MNCSCFSGSVTVLARSQWSGQSLRAGLFAVCGITSIYATSWPARIPEIPWLRLALAANQNPLELPP